MNHATQSEDRFLQWLDSLVEDAKASQHENHRRGEQFEAVLDQIRGNVASVYRRMFVLACQEEVPWGSHDHEIARLMQAYPSGAERVPAIFRHLLEKIAKPWADGLEQAERHDDPEAIVKERVKLAVVARIREKIGELYPQARGAERG
jgi:hypothetical protein